LRFFAEFTLEAEISRHSKKSLDGPAFWAEVPGPKRILIEDRGFAALRMPS